MILEATEMHLLRLSIIALARGFHCTCSHSNPSLTALHPLLSSPQLAKLGFPHCLSHPQMTHWHPTLESSKANVMEWTSGTVSPQVVTQDWGLVEKSQHPEQHVLPSSL